MANQYSFFDEALSARFIRRAAEHGIAGQVRPDPIAGMVVELPDDVPDDLFDAIEAHYDELMEEQRELVEAMDEESAGAMMGVDIVLSDGTPCRVRLPAGIGRRLNEHFNGEEIHALVEAVAASVAHPSMARLCCDP